MLFKPVWSVVCLVVTPPCLSRHRQLRLNKESTSSQSDAVASDIGEKIKDFIFWCLLTFERRRAFSPL